MKIDWVQIVGVAFTVVGLIQFAKGFIKSQEIPNLDLGYTAPHWLCWHRGCISLFAFICHYSSSGYVSISVGI